jgi:hypothetical protein|tara:strand:- start:374 stop:607 length:234 start_codon:yes stop_codon:yes gene_type:complete
MQPIILIAWNTLTTGWDSYVDTFSTNEQMTYLDLLTELQSLPEELLTTNVKVYDEDVNDVCDVRRIKISQTQVDLII